MNNLTELFPDCKLTTLQIREVIRSVLGMTESSENIYYFCYKCFRYIGTNVPKGLNCRHCFQIYCSDCALLLSVNRQGKEIDRKKCLQCQENLSYLGDVMK